MTNQTAHPSSGKPAQPGSAQPGSAQAGPGQSPGGARRGAPGTPPRKRRSTSLMLALVMLIAAVFAVVLLSPDQLREIVAPFTGRTTPSATIAVAPPGSPATGSSSSGPSSSAPAPSAAAPSGSSPTPAAPRPSASSAIPSMPPSSAPPSAAITAELQTLRTMLADVTGRVGDLERSGTEPRAGELENRLNALDSRIGALIEQPVVTPSALADALTETRQAAQAAAQEAAQAAAHDAARTAADQAAQKAAQDATNATERAAERAAERAVQDAVQKATAGQKDMAPAVADLEKRLSSLEKMAPAVVAIADIDKRLTAIEKMAPAVAAIADQERRLASLEKTAASASSLSELDRRLAAVEKSAGPLAAMSQSALQGEALALGLLNLRLALDRGVPYAEVLSALRVAAANDAVLVGEIDRLAPVASSGAPTVATLRQRLLTIPVMEEPNPVAAAPSATSEGSAESSGFWADIGRRFGSIITVRRLDANAQTTGAASSSAAVMGTAIERASARLAANDVAGAIGLLDDPATRRNLTPTQQAALDDWLREARARLTAETGFATLSRRSLALFSAKMDLPMSPAPASVRPGTSLAPSPMPSNATPIAPPAIAPSITEPQGADAATPGDMPPGQ